MTGIDTNVLVRYITRDHPDQYSAAKEHLESHCTKEAPGYVSVIVLCELAWVLSRAYDADQNDIAQIIDQILRTRQLQVEQRDQVRSALSEYIEQEADFADCLIGQLNRSNGADETVTFDQNAAHLRHWRELDW